MNPLQNEKISKLMLRFAVPSIIAMMVSALYNIIDQLFIGQAVGSLGNAATNIAFPLSMLCTALALTFGIGGASCYNLTLGSGDQKSASHYIGNAITMLFVCGITLCVITQIFLPQLLIAFGSPNNVLPYAITYVRITSIGFPFLIITIGGGHIIRADGRPKISMICNITGALINTLLDALFVMGFHWGMEGAALATIIGQVVSGCMAIYYFTRFKTAKVSLAMLVPKWRYLSKIIQLGSASFFNQVSMMIVQIVLNNSLRHYGARSDYGEAIPIACSGIVSKVSMLYIAVVIGIAQGTQPIESFNYGAKQYKRVKDTYKLALFVGSIIAITAFLVFQIFPEQIMAAFGETDEKTLQFGTKFFRIYLFFTFINFLQPITATFFTSIGKAYKGMFLSLTRQFLFLLPLILLLPLISGIDGIVFSATIADFLAFFITLRSEERRVGKECED